MEAIVLKIGEFIEAEIEKAEQSEEYVPDVLKEIALKVTQKYGHKCALEYIGGYENPGYEIDCYAFGYVEDGEVKIYGYNHESY